MNLSRLDFAARKQCYLDPDRVTLVGVSGGPDSLCLLDGLRQLGYRLVAAYFFHGLRPEAELEAAQLKERMDAWKIPFVTEGADVRAYAAREHLSIEDAARNLRYRFLFDQAESQGAQAVAVGHNADDQVESVLMHFIQGAGPTGLKGMAFRSLQHGWHASLPLVRPLLDVWKNETQSYCEVQDLHPFIDASNADLNYFRNRLRHEIIPILETCNPHFRQALARTAKIVTADQEYLETQLDAAWALCCEEQSVGWVKLSRKALLEQPLSLRRGTIRRAFLWLADDPRDLDFATVEKSLHWIQDAPRKGQADLAGKLRIVVQTHQIWLARWEASLPVEAGPQLEGNSPVYLATPGEIQVGNGWSLEISLENRSEDDISRFCDESDGYTVFLDADQFQWPVEIRTRKPGERFKPLGMQGRSIKLTDFWINEKLPRSAREAWPLVCVSGIIAWVPGFRLGEDFRIRAETRHVAKLQLSRGRFNAS